MPKVIDAWQDWYCPECKKTDQTKPLPANASRMHYCTKLRITAPLSRKGVRTRLISVEREDYVGNEKVTLNEDGRPVMSIRVMRDNGMDAVVFAPVARISAQA